MAFFSFDSFSTKKKRKKTPSDSESSEPPAPKKAAAPKAGSSTQAPPGDAAAEEVLSLTASSGHRETVGELLAASEDLKTTAELVRRFILVVHRAWKTGKGGEGGAADTVPDLGSLQPLLDLVCAKALDEKEEDHMRNCCLQSLRGEHLLAQKSYLDLIHGSKTWVTGGLLYISSDEPKGNERMWGQKWRKIEDKDHCVTRMAGGDFDGDLVMLSWCDALIHLLKDTEAAVSSIDINGLNKEVEAGIQELLHRPTVQRAMDELVPMPRLFHEALSNPSNKAMMLQAYRAISRSPGRPQGDGCPKEISAATIQIFMQECLSSSGIHRRATFSTKAVAKGAKGLRLILPELRRHCSFEFFKDWLSREFVWPNLGEDLDALQGGGVGV
ncbi:unnamed protein product [Symbiodinium natans]|uniref:Uncharacterized protein n=1 Tax=Symbiodinium natans TaxID=878477 RepID=A0A812QG52_9DINO|nr:unnamed protein product [Symbiodinium natans]